MIQPSRKCDTSNFTLTYKVQIVFTIFFKKEEYMGRSSSIFSLGDFYPTYWKKFKQGVNTPKI